MTSKYIHIFQDTKIPAIGSYCVIFPDGGMHFWVDGLRHREDGPAVVESDGYMRWYRKDKLHREDGPAIIDPGFGGQLYWYLNGHQYSKEDYTLMLFFGVKDV